MIQNKNKNNFLDQLENKYCKGKKRPIDDIEFE